MPNLKTATDDKKDSSNTKKNLNIIIFEVMVTN